MRITFAYPTLIDGRSYDPDETAEVDDAMARRLVNEGFARLPEETDVTVAELRALAEALGVDLGGYTRKADILRELEPHMPRVVAPVTVQTGAIDPPPNPTVAELRAFAKDRGMTTAEAKAAWTDAHAAPQPPTTPDTGTDQEK